MWCRVGKDLVESRGGCGSGGNGKAVGLERGEAWPVWGRQEVWGVRNRVKINKTAMRARCTQLYSREKGIYWVHVAGSGDGILLDPTVHILLNPYKLTVESMKLEPQQKLTGVAGDWQRSGGVERSEKGAKMNASSHSTYSVLILKSAPSSRWTNNLCLLNFLVSPHFHFTWLTSATETR